MVPVLVRRGVNPPYSGALPAQPTDLAIAGAGLTWTDNAENETGYRVEESATGTGGWSTTDDTLPANSESYAGPLEAGVFYRVVAFNDAGDSLPSGVIEFIGWQYPTFDDAEASGDSWVNEDTVIAIDTGIHYKYFSALGIVGHSGLIQKYPTGGDREVVGVTVQASWEAQNWLDSIPPLVDASTGSGVVGYDGDGENMIRGYAGANQGHIETDERLNEAPFAGKVQLLIIDGLQITAGNAGGGSLLVQQLGGISANTKYAGLSLRNTSGAAPYYWEFAGAGATDVLSTDPVRMWQCVGYDGTNFVAGQWIDDQPAYRAEEGTTPGSDFGALAAARIITLYNSPVTAICNYGIIATIELSNTTGSY